LAAGLALSSPIAEEGVTTEGAEFDARPMPLSYDTLEQSARRAPVDRLAYIADRCRGKTVLDVGCLDETALLKRDTQHWLHGRIAAVARRVVGVDNSSTIPADGIVTAANAVIYRGDGVDIDPPVLQRADYDIIVAGEFVEHIENPIRFLRNLRQVFPGRELIISTPNGVCFANTLLGSSVARYSTRITCTTSRSKS
jgi:2-polyprenyl-3-methyl-5-hydroxy-6-metoxy-1,4-benzoquinol methylase